MSVSITAFSRDMNVGASNYNATWLQFDDGTDNLSDQRQVHDADLGEPDRHHVQPDWNAAFATAHRAVTKLRKSDQRPAPKQKARPIGRAFSFRTR